MAATNFRQVSSTDALPEIGALMEFTFILNIKILNIYGL